MAPHATAVNGNLELVPADIKAPCAGAMRPRVGLRIVAMFEGAKGLPVLRAGFGLFVLLHRNAWPAAERLFWHFNLNPANHHPRIFLHRAEGARSLRVWLPARGALA